MDGPGSFISVTINVTNICGETVTLATVSNLVYDNKSTNYGNILHLAKYQITTIRLLLYSQEMTW